jgi:glutamate formiminotransferase/formiminotetrahydrofolate cyclodeaminase
LDDLAPFDAKERVIEYRIEATGQDRLLRMGLKQFAEETASESPAPGGGSVAAYIGALGVSLATMVANLSAHKRGWDDRWEIFSDAAVRGMELQRRLLVLVDADTAAFDRVMAAFGMSQEDAAAKAARAEAIEVATRAATEVPMQVAQLCLDAMELAREMAERGNPNSITDAAVGAMALRTGVLGAVLNARINARELKDQGYAASVEEQGAKWVTAAERAELEIREILERAWSSPA